MSVPRNRLESEEEEPKHEDTVLRKYLQANFPQPVLRGREKEGEEGEEGNKEDETEGGK